ncbi:MAG: hypothetical protein PVF45_11675, partial [Anaerolineae bacterium]
MSITMQGAWTVSVKSKSAAYPQRFIVSGATSGNGTYASNNPPVSVTGDSWSITIQADPGTGFVDSEDRIKFPTGPTGHYQFDIESNDVGADQDFNDLILTCSITPEEGEIDFLIYGNVSYYGSGCIVNPCHTASVVIDTALGLSKALQYPVLRAAIEKLYPERLRSLPPRLPPLPDPPPFRPLVIPLYGQTALPPKQAQILKVSPVARSKDAQATLPHVSTLGTFTPAQATQAIPVVLDRIGIASLLDRFRLQPFCTTGALPGVVLRFQEYDRTNAELAGGAYTGDGDRETLGLCVTDMNGNYIFRFSRSITELAVETAVDVAPGEDVTVHIMPDVIVQVLDPMAPSGFSYESAPYWNVPLLKRIDLCVPEAKGVFPCAGENIIQAIGNIFIGEPQSDGSRVGFNNYLGAEGRITAK